MSYVVLQIQRLHLFLSFFGTRDFWVVRGHRHLRLVKGGGLTDGASFLRQTSSDFIQHTARRCIAGIETKDWKTKDWKQKIDKQKIDKQKIDKKRLKQKIDKKQEWIVFWSC